MTPKPASASTTRSIMGRSTTGSICLGVSRRERTQAGTEPTDQDDGSQGFAVVDVDGGVVDVVDELDAAVVELADPAAVVVLAPAVVAGVEMVGERGVVVVVLSLAICGTGTGLLWPRAT